ncbi:MAG TPA: protoporphyrinogen oxidase [Pirellulales bacterium]|nr:protoporphyrinogen oxidase [Pirellulales bacterium]
MSPESRLATPELRSLKHRIAVIGGGVSGLAAAHRLRELDPRVDVTVFEAGPRVGGSLCTERRDGFLLEHGADNFITNLSWGLDLCRRLGIEEQLIPTRPEGRRVFVVRDGRLHPVPEGFMVMAPGKLAPVLATPLLSTLGKLRIIAEALVPRRKDEGDESLASFATRRLGREAFERLVQPLVAGIYTADATKLSLAATLPRFLDMEREHGSMIRAMMRQPKSSNKSSDESGARYSLFVAPKHGMSTIVDALVERIGRERIRLNTPVERVVHRSEGGWRLMGSGEWGRENCGAEDFDAVIVSTPAPKAAHVLQDAAPELSQELRAIEYAGSVVAIVGYRSDQFPQPLQGFGFVVPDVERRDILAVSYSSQKYDDRAPEGHVLLRVFLGGAGRPDLVHDSDDELRRIVEQQLRELLQVRGEPVLWHLARWPSAMPQYHVGHLDRVARIESLVARVPTLALAGNAYRGVGIPQCIHSGEAAAERIPKTLLPLGEGAREAGG